MGVYERLARKLGEMPNGFPRTETGVELKILRKIFLPEEAEVFTKMTLLPETAAKIAERLDKSIGDTEAFWDRMVRRGEIGTDFVNGERMYFLLPFIVGIYEAQRNVLDEELAELVQEYMPTFMKTLGGFPPALGRVVPIGIEVPAEFAIYRSEDVRQMIENAESFNLKTCICRKGKELVGSPCKHKKGSYCLSISRDPSAFTGAVLAVTGKNISREETLKVVADAEAEGLVHCTFNVRDWNTVPICNCCECCCEILHAVKTLDAPHILAKSEFVAQIDQDRCSACGVCKDERCPMDAIAEDQGSYTVIGERCIGCGVCTVTCPTKAITLKQKAEVGSTEAPANLLTWFAERAKSRGVEFPS
ncbi:MAG: 4Fe-4S binding protein [candidate division WOR-3 bacterium]